MSVPPGFVQLIRLPWLLAPSLLGAYAALQVTRQVDFRSPFPIAGLVYFFNYLAVLILSVPTPRLGGSMQIFYFISLLLPPLVGAYVGYHGMRYFGFGSSYILYALVYLIDCTAILWCRLIYTRVFNRLEAEKKCAIYPPHIKESPWRVYLKRVSSAKNEYLGDMWRKWADMHGNIFGFTLTDYRIFTLEPVHVKAILATQFEDFGKGPVVYDRWKSLLGSGIFNSDGDMWKFHRSTARPYFSKDRISDFATFGRHADRAITRIAGRLSEGQPVDIQDAAARFTLDSATEFLFGQSVDSMAAGLPYPESSGIPNPSSFSEHPSNSFVNAFTLGLQSLSGRGRLGSLWRLGDFWKDRAASYREEVNRYIDPIIKKALANDIVEEQETFLSSLVAQTKDYKVIQDQIINILVAGRDTTAHTLMFAVYMLSQHPEMAKRLREEIILTIGEARLPTYQDIRDMKFLRAFLNETLRLYPIVPFNTRTATRATTLPSTTPDGKPFYVPANTPCLYSVFLMHRRTDLWGPDAEKFDPDRFLDHRVAKYLTPNPFIFLPFNGGPRICLGQQFAYNEMSFFLIRLLQRFSAFSLARDAQPASSFPPVEWSRYPGTKGTDKIRIQAALTMSAKGGMWVRMEEAKMPSRL